MAKEEKGMGKIAFVIRDIFPGQKKFYRRYKITPFDKLKKRRKEKKKEITNPRKLKKYYMKILRNEELYKEFLKLYDEAVKEDSSIPEDLAWIRFKRIYHQTEDGWEPS